MLLLIVKCDHNLLVALEVHSLLVQSLLASLLLWLLQITYDRKIIFTIARDLSRQETIIKDYDKKNKKTKK